MICSLLKYIRLVELDIQLHVKHVRFFQIFVIITCPSLNELFTSSSLWWSCWHVVFLKLICCQLIINRCLISRWISLVWLNLSYDQRYLILALHSEYRISECGYYSNLTNDYADNVRVTYAVGVYCDYSVLVHWPFSYKNKIMILRYALNFKLLILIEGNEWFW